MLFIAVFVILPILEITAYIFVGGHIGVMNTILLSFLMAIIGGLIVKTQGFETLNAAQNAFRRGDVPAIEIFDGLLIMLAAGFLITPGFVTDIFGFLLLIPAVRRLLREYLQGSATLNIAGFDVNFTEFYKAKGYRHPSDPEIIEGTYENITPEEPSARIPSDKP